MSKNITKEEEQALINTLKARFDKYPNRHKGISWERVEVKLREQPAKLWSLCEMERTGGEPDVIAQDSATGEFLFVDCSAESPAGRRSLCYDAEALAARKENKPKDSVIAMASTMGAELLTETQYRDLQQLGTFDTKTSSWVKTPDEIRKLGGAIFGDCRFGRVFIYHNGAESYYAARAFRAVLRV